MARYRTKTSIRIANGSGIWVSGGTVMVNQTQLGQTNSSYAYCTDTVQQVHGTPFSDNFLFIEKGTRSYTNLGGRSSSDPLNYKSYSNYDAYWNRTLPGPIMDTLPSDGSSMATAMARSNPGRAVIGVPTFLGEMKDFVPGIKRAGQAAIRARRRAENRAKSSPDNHHYDPKGPKKPPKNPNDVAKALADAYITYRFAMAPLISDLGKLLDFQAAADKRCKELDRLYSTGGLRRRIQLVDASKHEQKRNFTIASSLGTFVDVNIDKITRVRRWATLRWRPTSPPSFKTDKDKHDLARSLVLGLNVEGLTMAAWNLLPWSWLADWFVNASDVIGATNNAVPCTAVGRCLMTHIHTSESYTRTNPNWVTGGDAMFTYETKGRTLGAGISLNTNLPFLNGSQLSILGALSVSRS